MKMKNRAIYAFILCMMIESSVLTGCGMLPQEKEYQAAPVIIPEEESTMEFATVMRGDIKEEKSITVEKKIDKNSLLSFGISGEKKRTIYVKAGDSVVAGQLLAELDTKEWQDKIEDCENQMSELNIKIAQQEELMTIDEENSNTYAREKMSLENQCAVLNQKEKEYTTRRNERQIYADIDGTITYINTEETTSDENTMFITITGKNSKLEGSTDSIENLQVGKDVLIKFADTNYEGVISSIDDSDQSKYNIVFDLIDPSAEINLGTVTYTVKEAKDVLYVPSSTVVKLENKSYVYVPNEEGFRQEKEVTVGETLGDNTIILGGITEGDTVIIL